MSQIKPEIVAAAIQRALAEAGERITELTAELAIERALRQRAEAELANLQAAAHRRLDEILDRRFQESTGLLADVIRDALRKD